ncbi:MAG: Gfo/Idh/MocA family oxidoreductase [Saprospiraceae bacterium]
MKRTRKSTRRSFVKKLAAGALATGLIPSNSARGQSVGTIEWEGKYKKFSANDKIRLAGIGMGIMGFNNCRSAVKVPGSELVAVCDLYDGRMQHAREVFGNHLFTTRDYEEILARQDVDAVIISTSDHWHDHIAIAAMKAGKAVYCEKPMVQHIDEGRAVIDTQKKTGKVVQVGSQRVSSIVLAKAQELYKSGTIGQLVAVEAWNDRQSSNGAWQYSIPTDASEKTVDWERFQGDAPKHPFDPVRFFRWRNYKDYGTGVAGDLFVHLFSGLHFVTESMGPERVFATGGLRYWKDGRDVPDYMAALFDYPESATHPAFNFQLRVNFTSGDGGSSKSRLVGTDGIIEVGWDQVILRKHKVQSQPTYGGWDSYDTFSEAQQKEYAEWYRHQYPPLPEQMEEPGELVFKAPEGYNEHLDHHTNFIRCIRENAIPVENAVFGFRAAAPSLAANMSYFEKKVVNWDPVKMVLK